MDARTYLFVPGHRPERFAKAVSSGADLVVLDLEDAVAESDKPAARMAVATYLQAQGEAARQRLVVRVHEAGSSHHAEDLAALADTGLGRLMLAKAQETDPLAALSRAWPGVRLLPLIETARGLAQCQALAMAPGVERLVFGTLDLSLDLDLELETDLEPLAWAAGQLTLASRLAGLPAPVAGVTPQIDDDDRLRADATWERRRGFGAKLCIHPRQVSVIHQVLAPDDRAVQDAHRVLAAEAASPGAARLDGRMIDRPVVLRARRVLARVRR